jgi:hypothetical protein
MSNSWEILIFQHFRRVVPRLAVLIFNKKKASSMKQVDILDMFQRASKSVST